MIMREEHIHKKWKDLHEGRKVAMAGSGLACSARMILPRYLLLIFLMLMISVRVSGLPQHDDKKAMLDEKEWQEMTDGKDYTETSRKYSPACSRQASNQEDLEKTFNFPAFFQILAYIMLIGILAALIWFLISSKIISVKSISRKKGRKDKDFELLDDDPENISDTEELKRLLQEALQQKMYAIAVRINFILLLRLLDERRMLRFQIDKTNGTYVNELSGSDHEHDFRKIVLVFEKVWYGDLPVGRMEFDAISGMFNRFTQKFEAHEK